MVFAPWLGLGRAAAALSALFVCCACGSETPGGAELGAAAGEGENLHRLVINEMCAQGACQDFCIDADCSYGADWLELYNGTDAAIDVSGYYLTDSVDPLSGAPTYTQRLGCDRASMTIEAGGFLVLIADDRVQDGPDHISLGLARGGEANVILAKPPEGADPCNNTEPGAEELDRVVLPAGGSVNSRSRNPDGADSWGWCTPTAGEPNHCN
jgi:hypothetical protein